MHTLTYTCNSQAYRLHILQLNSTTYMLIDLWGCMLQSTRVIGLRKFRFEEDQQGKSEIRDKYG